jgi:hypothetical protein
MFQASNLNLSYEQLRSVMVEMLRSGGGSRLNDLKTAVPAVAMRMGLMADPAGPSQNTDGPQVIRYGYSGSQVVLSDHEYGRVRNIFWDLVIEGILRPGLADGLNNDLPFFHVTEWGKVALTNGPNTPYDPDGYLARLKNEVPSLDPVIVTYLNESLHTFRIGCLLSSTIALGCASEKALLLLVAAYADSLGAGRQKFKDKTDGRMIKRQFDDLRKAFEGELRARLPHELEDGLDVELNALFDFIRNQRNDAGHPTGKMIERERAYANVLVFPTYVKKVYSLIDWLAANPRP